MRYCDVRSQTFEVRVDVDHNGLKRTYFEAPGQFNHLMILFVQFYWK